jgi:hypothetical protein
MCARRSTATSRYSRTDMCCAYWERVGVACSRQHFLLDTGTLCILGYYRDVPAVKVWNGPSSLSWRRSAKK